MFSSITLAEADNKPLIETPRPNFRIDSNGNALIRDGRVLFDVKSEVVDFQITKNSPVKQCFYKRYVVDAKYRAKPVELSVFFYLVMTTEWSVVQIVVSSNGAPVLTADGRGLAVIKTYGNRSATRTIDEIAKAVGASYGAVQKALAFWVKEGVMIRISEYKKKSKSIVSESGRPVDYRRYEFNPRFVWNGHIWVGNSYDLYFNKIII